MSDEKTKTGRKNLVRAVLAWGGTFALLSFLAYTTDFATAWSALRHADHALFATTAVLATVATYVTDVATMGLLLRRVGVDVRFGELMRVKGASYLLNIVNYNLALVMMAAVVKKRTERGWGAAGSPFLLLNFLDLSVFGWFVLGAVVAGQSPFPRTATLMMTVAAAGAVSGPWALCGVARLGHLPGLLGKLFGHDLLAAFRRLSLVSIPMVTAARSLLILEYAAMTWAFLRSFQMHLPFVQLLVYMPIVAIVALVPVSVSGLGSTQVLMREFYRPAATAALAASLLHTHLDAEQTRQQVSSLIDAFSTAAIVAPILLRVLIGLVCLPSVSRGLVAEGAEK